MKARMPWKGTMKQKDALRIELRRQVLAADKEYACNMDTVVLYTLHTHLGFGKKRLKRFYDAFIKTHQEMVDFYQYSEDDVWIYKKKLQDIGVDVDEWYQKQPIVYKSDE